MTTGATIVSQERVPLALSAEANRFATAWREHLDVYLDELVVEVNEMPAGTEQQLAAHHLGRARERCTVGCRGCKRLSARGPASTWNEPG